ncbi:carboxymuconolactone decarboxylase family protein [Microbacterium sp.]|uniref:carboxymuconolactone decarboxylase family protein n=1 Tax=Microbacterium sp. TaxID=51671 RepID=UPI003C27E330
MSKLDELRSTSPAAADAFRLLRNAADHHAGLDEKQREFCSLAAFAATRNEGAFRIHASRAREAGATEAELEQVVLLLLGTSSGLVPVLDALRWIHAEFAAAS